jgi:phage baseplate assembly protein gpV
MAEEPNNQQPSRDPADDGSLAGTLRQVMKKMMQGTDGMLPATVISFDRATNRATVKPVVMMVGTDGSTLGRAQIASVPVFQIGAGGFMLNFNLKAGDLGWLMANDRDTSLFLQGGTEQPPNTLRMKSFEDGVFFPDALRNFIINPEDEENAVFQTLDGTVRVALWPDQVKITAPKVLVETPDATIDATLTTITGDATINGNLQVDGDATANGIVTGLTDVQAGTKLLKNHDHGNGALIAGKTAVNN